MSETTLRPNVTAEACRADGIGEIESEEGLRRALRAIEKTGWNGSPGRALLAEIRRRAVRNAAHVASATETTVSRGLVDDILLAAWMILREHGSNVAQAERPWAYLMSSAQRQMIDETRAQHLLTNTGAIRGRAREILPFGVRPIGSTSTDLATAGQQFTVLGTELEAELVPDGKAAESPGNAQGATKPSDHADDRASVSAGRRLSRGRSRPR